jgi:hypothetical protein
MFFPTRKSIAEMKFSKQAVFMDVAWRDGHALVEKHAKGRRETDAKALFHLFIPM